MSTLKVRSHKQQGVIRRNLKKTFWKKKKIKQTRNVNKQGLLDIPDQKPKK